MSEHDYAKMEGNRIAFCDEYFNARPERDYHINRSLFDAGHDSGWKAMQTQCDELLKALRIAVIPLAHAAEKDSAYQPIYDAVSEAIQNASK